MTKKPNEIQVILSARSFHDLAEASLNLMICVIDDKLNAGIITNITMKSLNRLRNQLAEFGYE
jgi:hypothetical protein